MASSTIKINSISIDLAGATDEIGAGKCEHFAIRGFVSEIRQRDWKKCWPFSMDSELDGQNHPLPSLSVPKSRWWCCESCIQDINAEEINNCGGVKLLSHCQLHSSSKTLRERMLDAKALDIPSKNEVHSPIDAGKKERNDDVFGNSIGPGGNENANREICEKGNRIEEILKKARHRSVDGSPVGSKGRKLAFSGQASRKFKDKANILTEINQKENQEAKNGQIAEAMTTFGSSDIAGVVDDTPEAINENGHVSVEADEYDNLSSESAIFARNFLDHTPYNITNLHRRKARKIRLLSELLNKGNTRTSNVIRNEESPCKREFSRGGKRKLSVDEEWRPPVTMPQNSYVRRKLSKIGKNSGKAFQSSDSEDNTLSGVASQPSGESQSTDNGFDRVPFKGKKKNKRFQVVDEHLPAVSRDNSQGVQENDEGLPKHTPSVNNFASSAHASFAGKALVPCPLHSEKTERKSSLAKKKNKKSLICNKKNPVFTFSHGMPKGNQSKTRKAEVLQTNYVDVSAQSNRGVTNGKWLDPSSEKLFPLEGHAQTHVLQLEDGAVFSLPWHEIHQKDFHDRSRDSEAIQSPDFASSSKLNADGCVRTRAYIDRGSNGNTNILPFLNERHIPSAEVADHSLMLQKDTSGAHNKGKTVVIQESSGTSKIQSDHRNEKTPEHLDDIPMEIVELMAKNQYERCLPDREDNNNSKQPSQATTSTSRNALLIDLNKSYENGFSLENSNSLRQHKPLSKNSRKIDATKGEYFLTEKPNSMDFSPRSQFGQSCMPSGFRIFPVTRGNTSSSIQFSGGQCNHNCQWLGNMSTIANQNPSPSSFRILRACNTCQSVPQQFRESSHHIWPSSIISQNQMPVSFSVPRKFVDQPTNSRASNNDLNSWNLNFLNPGNKKRGSDLEYSFSCKHDGVSGRSLDPYSNESSIPAMHLLSLMDPRLRSQTVDLPGNPIFMKKSSMSQVHQSEGFPGPNKAANPPKLSPFDFYSRRLSPETSRENFAAIPAVGMSSFSFQNTKSFAKGTEFTVQASRKHPVKKTKRKDNTTAMYNSQKSIFTSSNLGKFQLLGTPSDAMMLPLKFHPAVNNMKQKAREQSNIAAGWPPKGTSGPITCSFNRNPADFTIPEPGNVYMIKGVDLKIRKRPYLKKKPSSCQQDAQKQSKKPVGPA